MVKRCCWGACNTDSRYPDRLAGGVIFVPFPKPARSLEKCMRWIRLCRRPREQLNVDVLRDRSKGKHFYVCSKHFKYGQPTTDFPDPESASPYDKPATPRRPPPRKRESPAPPSQKGVNHRVFRVSLTGEHIPIDDETECVLLENENVHALVTPPPVAANQDDTSIITVYDHDTKNLDLLSLTAESQRTREELESEKNRLREDVAKLVLEKEDLMRTIEDQRETCQERKVNSCGGHCFRYDAMKHDDFQYYTGFSFERYLNVVKFLVPNDSPFQYSRNMSCLNDLNLHDQLLLVFIKLRQNFDFKHLSTLFGISPQDCSTLFSDWINFMFQRLEAVSVWPHRDVILENMPAEFRQEFPDTMVIIDGTEVKVQEPSSLQTQSKFNSDYKSCTTLKGIVGVDPRGSIIFASMLFSESISDNELTEKCGFYDLLKKLLSSNMLKEGDGIMADKEFTIAKNIKDLGLKLNIPPFASTSEQTCAADVTETIKIAKHRVHVERAIARVKQFKILSHRINLGLFKYINQVWPFCCLLTNFMPFLISKDE